MKSLIVVIFLFSISLITGQQSANMLQQEAERHMQAGRFGEAINMLDELIVLQPGMPQVYVMRGKCFEGRSQFKLAVDDLRKANQLKPNDKDIIRYLTELEKSLKSEIKDKISKLEKELSLNSLLYNHYTELAEFYLEIGDKEKAEKLYKQYIDVVELSPQIILRYGEFLAKNNKLKEGESAFEKYVKLYPDNEMIKSRHGYFNLWLGNFKNAENIFSEVLRKNPDLKEAQDGFKQAKAKGYFKPAEDLKEENKITRNTDIPGSKIEQFRKILSVNPEDYKTRLSMVDELTKAGRLEESFDQLQIILNDTLNVPTFSTYRSSLVDKRDSVFNIIIGNYKNQLDFNPKQKSIVSRTAYFYSSIGDYDKAMNVLSNYFNQSDADNPADLRFQYALYASWKGEFDKSLESLDYLLSIDPDNLQYQLLKGKLLVWSNKNLVLAETYLQNNLKSGNQSLEIILTLASLYIQNNQLGEAEKFISWAKSIDPKSEELSKMEVRYDNHKKLLREQHIYSLIEEGRKYMQEGKCENALIKFDEYFSQINNPTESELIEYADLYHCLKNLDKAIEIYDRILKNNINNYDVVKLRAKDLLWKKDYQNALVEFQKLSSENPDDYECKILLGEAYQNLGKYSMAGSIYDDVLKKSSDEKIIEMVNMRMAYMPQTGFNSLFSNFPSPIGLMPSIVYYSDNQDFSLNRIGGRVEVGIAKILTGGVSYSDVTLQSLTDDRKFVEFKGHLFLNISDEIYLSGSYGTLNSLNLTKKNIGDALIKYSDEKSFSAEVSYTHSDAAMILYSPHLTNFRYNADIYKIAGLFDRNKKLYLSGYFSYLSISDGNAGNDFMLRVGSQLMEDAYFGYEARYINYKYDSPFVPFSNGSLKLYYSPQNLDSHSLWTKWKLENSNAMKLQFGGLVGYIPLYNIVLRQIEGDIKYSPVDRLIINLQLVAGSSYRFDSSYNYFSGLMSVYWNLY